MTKREKAEWDFVAKVDLACLLLWWLQDYIEQLWPAWRVLGWVFLVPTAIIAVFVTGKQTFIWAVKKIVHDVLREEAKRRNQSLELDR